MSISLWANSSNIILCLNESYEWRHFQTSIIMAYWRWYKPGGWKMTQTGHNRYHGAYSKNHEDIYRNMPVGKVHGANRGPIWDRQDPGGPPSWPHETIGQMQIHNEQTRLHEIWAYPLDPGLHLAVEFGKHFPSYDLGSKNLFKNIYKTHISPDIIHNLRLWFPLI